jgi:hypothetical protein
MRHLGSRALIAAAFLLGVSALVPARPAQAQLPFYTDDPSVTAPWKLHFEFFNEYDFLQSTQYPNLRQNTDNFKLNVGLPHNLEVDFDVNRRAESEIQVLSHKLNLLDEKIDDFGDLLRAKEAR